MPRSKKFDEEEVLIKAMNLFWKQGYSATCVQDLVSHLGINRASLYDTFGDKELLFKRSFEHYKESNTRGLKEFLVNQPDVKLGFTKLFENAIQESINDNDKKGCFVVNTTTELVPGDPKIEKAIHDNRNTFISLFYNYLKEAEVQRQFKEGKDLHAIASLLFILYNGIKVVSKIKPDKGELMASVKQVLSILD